MRKASPRVTLPISRAATPYCLAVSRRRASEEGFTDTTARAPRSPNAATSVGNEASSSLTIAPSRGAACCAPTEEDAATGADAKQDSARVTARPPSLTSWAVCTAPSAANATRQSMRRFSAARSMAEGSPETMAAIVLEYSLEENSRADSERRGLLVARSVQQNYSVVGLAEGDLENA